MKKLCILVLLILMPLCRCFSQGPYSKYLTNDIKAPFILVSKPDMTLTLVDSSGVAIVQYGIACSKYYGNKERRGDNKTPEGTFKITQLLDSKSIPHDFHDGKGPVVGAYGPWFMRLSVPGFNDIGIHGTHLPESIGTRATEGCIRLRNEDVLDLKKRVCVGTDVIILPDAIK